MHFLSTHYQQRLLPLEAFLEPYDPTLVVALKWTEEAEEGRLEVEECDDFSSLIPELIVDENY